MKKLLAIVLILAMALSIGACSKDKDGPSASKPESNASKSSPNEPQSESAHRIIYLVPELGDLSFADQGWAGCRATAEKHNWKAEVVEMGRDISNYENALLDVANSGKYDIVVCMSNSGLSDLCIRYAPDYPTIKFFCFDMSSTAKLPSGIDNMFGIAYKQNEGSFLVGALAGKLTKSNKVGVYVFNDIPIGNDFLAGYVAGVRHANPKAKLSIAYGEGTFDPAPLQEISSAMFDSGVDVIFGIDGQGFPGLAREATARGGFKNGIYTIGVNNDTYTIYKATKNADIADVIITSMLKNVDESIINALDRYAAGTLKFGVVEAYGIAEKGTGMADNEYYRQNTPPDVQNYMNQLQSDIVSGAVKIPSYFDFKDYDEFKAWRDK